MLHTKGIIAWKLSLKPSPANATQQLSLVCISTFVLPELGSPKPMFHLILGFSLFCSAEVVGLGGLKPFPPCFRASGRVRVSTLSTKRERRIESAGRVWRMSECEKKSYEDGGHRAEDLTSKVEYEEDGGKIEDEWKKKREKT